MSFWWPAWVSWRATGQPKGTSWHRLEEIIRRKPRRRHEKEEFTPISPISYIINYAHLLIWYEWELIHWQSVDTSKIYISIIYMYVYIYMDIHAALPSQVPKTYKQTVVAWRNTSIMKKQPRLLWWSMCLESSRLWPVASLEAFLLPIPVELLLASSRIHFSNNNRCDCEKSELMTWYRSSRDKYWRHLLIWFNKKRSGSRFGKIGDWDPLGRSFSFFEAETLRSYLNGWQK